MHAYYFKEVSVSYCFSFFVLFSSHKSSDNSLSPVNAGTTSGLPPPATAADTADGGGASSQTQDNNPPAWLPNFVIGGSPHFGVNYGGIVCAVTILFSLLQL